MGPETLVAILTVGTIVVGAATGLAGHLLGRRAASGHVNTSEAAVLWQQAQDMRGTLLAEKAKAEEQRDRLIEGYTQQILPALASTSQAVREVSGAVAECLRMLRAITEGGEQRASVPAADQARVR